MCGIIANHCGIKMFTGHGGISVELIILMLLFVPESLASTVWVEGQEHGSCS